MRKKIDINEISKKSGFNGDKSKKATVRPKTIPKTPASNFDVKTVGNKIEHQVKPTIELVVRDVVLVKSMDLPYSQLVMVKRV